MTSANEVSGIERINLLDLKTYADNIVFML